MTQERSTRTVTATVQKKGEEEDGWVLTLTIPEFKSSYPTVVNRVPADVAQALQIGKTYSLVLEQQNLKRGKDGSQLYDYYWGLARGHAFTEGAPPPPEPATPPKSRDAANPKDISIERQVALKEARAAAEFLISSAIAVPPEIQSGETSEAAEAFYTKLVGRLFRAFAKSLREEV